MESFRNSSMRAVLWAARCVNEEGHATAFVAGDAALADFVQTSLHRAAVAWRQRNRSDGEIYQGIDAGVDVFFVCKHGAKTTKVQESFNNHLLRFLHCLYQGPGDILLTKRFAPANPEQTQETHVSDDDSESDEEMAYSDSDSADSDWLFPNTKHDPYISEDDGFAHEDSPLEQEVETHDQARTIRTDAFENCEINENVAECLVHSRPPVAKSVEIEHADHFKVIAVDNHTSSAQLLALFNTVCVRRTHAIPPHSDWIGDVNARAAEDAAAVISTFDLSVRQVAVVPRFKASGAGDSGFLTAADILGVRESPYGYVACGRFFEDVEAGRCTPTRRFAADLRRLQITTRWFASALQERGRVDLAGITNTEVKSACTDALSCLDRVYKYQRRGFRFFTPAVTLWKRMTTAAVRKARIERINTPENVSQTRLFKPS